MDRNQSRVKEPMARQDWLRDLGLEQYEAAFRVNRDVGEAALSKNLRKAICRSAC
jgi:hypothetical protein